MVEKIDLFDLGSIWSDLPCDEDEIDAFSVWYTSLKRKHGFSAIRNDLDDMARKAADIGEGALLIRQVLASCWRAYQFNSNGDSMKLRRDEYRQADELREEISKLTESLSAKMSELRPDHPLTLNIGWASQYAQEQGLRLETPPGSMPSFTERWQAAIRSLADGMRHPTAGHRCGPFYHRTHVGCLDYGRPIEAGNLPTASTILLYDLVFTFRNFTANGSAFRLKAAMPSNGKPNYALAVAIVGKVLGENISVDNAKSMLGKLVRNNPGIRRGDWEYQKGELPTTN